MTTTKQKATGTAVATTAAEPTAPVAAPETPASLVPAGLAALFAGHEQEGLGEMTQADRTTPFLGIVQSLSPERDKKDAKYIEGAEEGDIFNTVTRELYKAGTEPVKVIPVFFEKVWNRWIIRKEGGGFLGSFKDAKETQPKFVPPGAAELRAKKQSELLETNNHWVLVQSQDGTWAPALIAMKVTQLSASRKFNTLMTIAANRFRAPTFAKYYLFSTRQDENSQGQSYYNYQIADGDWVTEELYQNALEFSSAIAAGLVQANPAQDQQSEPAASAAPEADTDPKRPSF